MPVNRETMLTFDEAQRARELARDRYHAMLCDVDFAEVADDLEHDGETARFERNLAVIAWRQACTLIFTERVVFENGVAG